MLSSHSCSPVFSIAPSPACGRPLGGREATAREGTLGLSAGPGQDSLVEQVSSGHRCGSRRLSAFSSCPRERDRQLPVPQQGGGWAPGARLPSPQEPCRAGAGSEGFRLIGLVFSACGFVCKDTAMPSREIRPLGAS